MEPPYTSTHEIASCMGLIVGEGCFSGDTEAPVLSVKLHARDPHPLEDLRCVFGGIINGPYLSNGREFSTWMLRGWELEEALPYLDRWLPHSYKREQYEIWKREWTQYFEHQRQIVPRDRPRFHRWHRDKRETLPDGH